MADIWILSSHVLKVSRVDEHLAINIMDLASQTVILVFAGKRLAVESSEDDSDVFGWFGKHRFTRDSRSNMAVVVDVFGVALGVLEFLYY